MRLIVIVALLVLAACGGSEGAAPARTGPLGAIDRGFRTEVETALRAAATAQETFRATSGAYTTNVGDLRGAGYRPTARVTVQIARADAGGYCLQATHQMIGEPFHFDSPRGSPGSGPC